MQDTLQLQKTNEVRKKNHRPQKNFASQLSFNQLRFSENKSIKKKKVPNSCVESSLWPSGFPQGFKSRGYKNNIGREGHRKTVIFSQSGCFDDMQVSSVKQS